MNLIIDIGNTLIKLYCFEGEQLKDKIILEDWNIKVIDHFISNNNISNAIISSVRNNGAKIVQVLSDKIKTVIELNSTTPLPIKVKYQTPETLGNDRLALAVAANITFPHENVLVIDAGTAITYDIVNEEGEYLGGNISPGIAMRFKALNSYTQKLPLLELTEDYSLLVNTTNKAIINGVMNGTVFEIEGFVMDFQMEYDNLKILLTGGDSNFFDKKLKNTIFVDQNLIGKGLNRILEYNV